MFSFFENRIQPFSEGPVTQPPKGLWAFCRHYTRGMEKYLVVMALLTGITATVEVFLINFLGKLIDWLGATTPEYFFSLHGDYLIFTSILLLIVLPGSVLLHNLLMHQTLLGNYPMSIRWRGHKYLLGQSISFFQDEFAGRIATKLMQTSLAVRETVMKVLDVFLYVSIYFVGVVVLISGVDLRLSIPLIIWLICYVGLLRYFIPRLRAISMKQADARSEMTGRIVDTYTNMNTVKLFSHSKREEEYSREAMDVFLQKVHPQMRLVTQLSTSVWTINALLIFSIAALSIQLWAQNAVTTGAIAAAIAVVLRIYSMSQWIMWEVSGLFENIGAVQDGINTLSQPQTIQDAPQADALTVKHGTIDFQHVKFHYGKGHGVIDDFSLSIKPGEKIGLVGRSGAGKSTLMNLLLRFYDLEGGSIRVDGQDISKVTQDSLRSQISVVTQDTSLLHRSIRDNIVYGRPDATDTQMRAATEKAHAHVFLDSLEDAKGRKGYDAHVGERGVKLSGGQRQRIAIARVLLKDAPILILDEATSALDSEVEAAIQENLQSLMENKTVIAIAHRLSTIAALDRLVVIDEGRIVEQGTHAELLNQGGIYAQLWARQSGGFIH